MTTPHDELRRLAQRAALRDAENVDLAEAVDTLLDQNAALKDRIAKLRAALRDCGRQGLYSVPTIAELAMKADDKAQDG